MNDIAMSQQSHETAVSARSICSDPPHITSRAVTSGRNLRDQADEFGLSFERLARFPIPEGSELLHLEPVELDRLRTKRVI